MTLVCRTRAGTRMLCLDCALTPHDCISSSSSVSSSTSSSLYRIPFGLKPSVSTVLRHSSSCSPSPPRLVAGPVTAATHRGVRRQLPSRPRAASGSVQQEEVASVRSISVGQVSLQGPREEMEDEVVVEVEGTQQGFLYAAIFDGHAGISSARFLRDEMYRECVTALEGGALLESEDLHEAEAALSRAFLLADTRLLKRLETIEVGAEKESGSTASVLFARSDRIVLAYVGDSRVVLSRGGKAEDLSTDHRPYGRNKKSFAEIKRIQEAGGWVSHGRVCGSLSVSRAFGDIQFKTQKQQLLDEGVQDRRWTESFASKRNLDGDWVLAMPDTSSMLLDEDVEFVVLASDGLWDSFKSSDAIQYVRTRLREHGDVQRASEEVAQEALMRNGQDNVTVVIIDYGQLQGDPLAEKPSWKLW